MSTGSSGPENVGQWGTAFDLQNVAVHASLLPNGKMLYWGRRWNFNLQDPTPTLATISQLDMNQHATKAFLWTPPKADDPNDSKGSSEPCSAQPKGVANEDVNLFCSGHAFQSDGTLFIAGGHLFDGDGINQACVYNPFDDTWSAKPAMNHGRWYPTTLTMPDGRTLCISGQSKEGINSDSQIWQTDAWVPMRDPPNTPPFVFPLYPRLHLSPKGRVFMPGPLGQSQFLDVNPATGVGSWTTGGVKERAAGAREYGCSVMYDSGKLIYTGGGNDAGSQLPSKQTEIIDLNAAVPSWSTARDMLSRRRQHNATVLPDGKVLVTGGSQGTGFSNVGQGQPVHTAELWDPSTGLWTKMADEKDDRCYHSVALLLPDGQIISAGGGEGAENPPIKSAQLFKPPYFFKGPRPTLASAPAEVTYNERFSVTVNLNGSGSIASKASWIRLGSVTHSNNMSQSLMWLPCEVNGSKITINAPANSNMAPPGYYMLFLLNDKGVPSQPSQVAKGNAGFVPNNIIRLKPGPAVANVPAVIRPALHLTRRAIVTDPVGPSIPTLDEKIVREQDSPPVTVGLTPVCPYGLGPCWSGAFEALQRVDDISVVRPLPDQNNAVAFVYLKRDILPDIEKWRKEFEKTANGSYHMRGIELTISGTPVRKVAGMTEQLMLSGTPTRPEVLLAPFTATSKIEYDMWAKAPRQVEAAEAGAYDQLQATVARRDHGLKIRVTGRLHGSADGFSLDVRSFELFGDAAPMPKL